MPCASAQGRLDVPIVPWSFLDQPLPSYPPLCSSTQGRRGIKAVLPVAFLAVQVAVYATGSP
ncbi:unnamed protein product [Periconia digitata]|uniref:Uncharacterized protein n=1 Tax=Periconia digitata TaxID=1303443 RepID=A0A9W4UTY3_9PLEO|nr:unnamed protein product [Periconia digitata]